MLIKTDQHIGHVQVGVIYPRHMQLSNFLGNNFYNRLASLLRRLGLQPLRPIDEAFGKARDQNATIESEQHPFDLGAEDFEGGDLALPGKFCTDDFGERAWWPIPIRVFQKVTDKTAPMVATNHTGRLITEVNLIQVAAPTPNGERQVGSGR